MAKIIKVKNKVESNCINFPVGYIYLSAVAINPGQYFGGTWEQIKDKFLLMAGDSYQAGSTGGEATHTLTIEEMPSHKHKMQTSSQLQGHNDGYVNNTGYALDGEGDSMFAGGGQAHNNMPPYLTVYGYKKIA